MKAWKLIFSIVILLSTFSLSYAEVDLEAPVTLDVKGMDIIRSSFPQKFKEFMKEIVIDVLTDVEGDIIDDKVTESIQESSDYKVDLLSILKSLSPSGFERICQRLLRESGFAQVKVTGKSGDGGIDGHGILEVNPFVTFNVLFQCKRYQGNVSSSQIRDFRGAMMGRADKGIMITTGAFTLDAKKEARRDGVPPIEIIDGEKLIEMFEPMVPKLSWILLNQGVKH